MPPVSRQVCRPVLSSGFRTGAGREILAAWPASADEVLGLCGLPGVDRAAVAAGYRAGSVQVDIDAGFRRGSALQQQGQQTDHHGINHGDQGRLNGSDGKQVVFNVCRGRKAIKRVYAVINQQRCHDHGKERERGGPTDRARRAARRGPDSPAAAPRRCGLSAKQRRGEERTQGVLRGASPAGHPVRPGTPASRGVCPVGAGPGSGQPDADQGLVSP